ncbi:PD-(D/E)XK nuclease-like domain-containing protein [Dactylosporangium sp. NPDC005572]|uniref:PD-(D/E)XK nuclease-like domain-containing protein n=1 Tax=Dactylosporangium sp. NPDC005572 TaxID=3156889 RepID=UPI0033A81574
MTAPAAADVGVYDGMPADAYHADPALSSSGAKLLLPPNCPAMFKHRQDNPEQRAVFELGQAAHKEVLGIGPKLVLVDRDRWDTTEVKAQVAAIRAAGGIPLKRGPYDEIKAMAGQLARHPMAAALLNPAHGRPELSLFWTDRLTGVAERARVDWLHERAGGRTVVVDYKTCLSAHPDALPKVIHSYGYHIQGAFYRDGVRALSLGDADTLFVLIFQEKQAPYLVSCVQLDPPALRTGRDLKDWATQIFADCTASGQWPGYGEDIDYVSLPPWAEHREGTA